MACERVDPQPAEPVVVRDMCLKSWVVRDEAGQDLDCSCGDVRYVMKLEKGTDCYCFSGGDLRCFGPDGPGDQAQDCPKPGQVCGEDGMTYASRCDASRAKVLIASEGACG